MQDKRTSERFNCEAPVIIEICETGKRYDGSLYNYSREGMYLELDYPCRPGVTIRVVIEKAKISRGPKSCLAQVVWCEEIPGAVVFYNYGIGVRHDPSAKFSKTVKGLQVIDGGARKNQS
jgi:hypothetical protein